MQDDFFQISELSADGRDQDPTRRPSVLHCTIAGWERGLVRRVRCAEPRPSGTEFANGAKMQAEQFKDPAMMAQAAEHTKMMRGGSDTIEEAIGYRRPFDTVRMYLNAIEVGKPAAQYRKYRTSARRA